MRLAIRRQIGLLSIALALALALACAPALAMSAPQQSHGYPPLTARGKAVAPCDASMRGVGIPLDQQPTHQRGPFGIFEFSPDFRQLRRYRHSLLREKAPVGVRGKSAVTLAVPPGARHRVALVYGGGRRAEIEFQPCPQKRRTAWPGGLVLRDRQPITLLVTVGEGPARELRLGRQ